LRTAHPSGLRLLDRAHLGCPQHGSRINRGAADGGRRRAGRAQGASRTWGGRERRPSIPLGEPRVLQGLRRQRLCAAGDDPSRRAGLTRVEHPWLTREEPRMTREISHTIEIDASPDQVWSVLSETTSFPSWNPFIRKLEGQLAVGAKLLVVIQPPGRRQS